MRNCVSRTVDVSQLISRGLGCTVMNAVNVINFNIASMLCDKITEELLAGLTSCLLSLVSHSTYVQFRVTFHSMLLIDCVLKEFRSWNCLKRDDCTESDNIEIHCAVVCDGFMCHLPSPGL